MNPYKTKVNGNNTKFQMLEKLVFSQSNKIADILFKLYRAEAFIDHIITEQKIEMSQDQFDLYSSIALQKVQKDFPRMKITIQEDKKTPDEKSPEASL